MDFNQEIIKILHNNPLITHNELGGKGIGRFACYDEGEFIGVYNDSARSSKTAVENHIKHLLKDYNYKMEFVQCCGDSFWIISNIKYN